jgi:acyl-CoA dehydrogenase
MNTHIPEAYGGPGLDYLSGCLIEEEIGWGCSGIGTSLMANGLASAPGRQGIRGMLTSVTLGPG